MSIKVVAEGTWTYGGSTQKRVWIVEADYDFWHEVAAADRDLEPGEHPDLNIDGVTYYVAFKAPAEGRFWPDRGGFRSQQDARRAAEDSSPSAVEWDG
jgi:hypothetical protein